MSLRGKLGRLEAAASEAALEARGPVLDDLRAKMHAILERTRLSERFTRAVQGPDLPFLTEETQSGPLHVRSLRLPASHRVGRAPVLPARDASRELLALLALDPALAACDPEGALYLDTETTGLARGTGTVAFLVGLAYWERPADGAPRGLVLEQLLVRNLGEEAPMLERVAARVAASSMIVSFNGKAFDMPLLRTRFVMAKLAAPKEPPHLDLVHVARRVHKPRDGKEYSCKLTSIEKTVLGFERLDDTPSGEVSACYLHFLRTGDTRALLGVVEHNAWDVVAMAALVGLYGEPLDGSQLSTDDLARVARTLRRAGEIDRAHDYASHAVSLGPSAESYRARAEIAKARGDKRTALADFEELARTVDDAGVRLELAKLYEHYVKAPGRALEVLAEGTPEHEARHEKRRRRLEKKLEREAQGNLPGMKRRA